MVNRSPRIRTCLRAIALQRAGVNFLCTAAAFTLPPEPAGFVVLCQLAQELSLPPSLLELRQDKCMPGFSQTRRSFSEDGLQTVGRPPAPRFSGSSTCLRLVLLVVSISMNTTGSRTGDLHPISSRPCRAYTKNCSLILLVLICFRLLLQF
jgi:hypothetical protein